MINKVILVGNVGADPEVRALEGGVKVARLRIATTERSFNRQTQETKEFTEWHSVTVWRNLADVVDKYVRKGSQLYIEGSLRTREWTDKDGNKRYTTEVVANELKMLGRRADAGAPGAEASAYGGGANASGSAQAQGGGYGASTSAPAGGGSDFATPALDEADDLPF